LSVLTSVFTYFIVPQTFEVIFLASVIIIVALKKKHEIYYKNENLSLQPKVIKIHGYKT